MPTRQKVLVVIAFVAMLLAAVAVHVFLPPSPDANEGWKGAMIGGVVGGIVGPLMAQRRQRRAGLPGKDRPDRT